MAMLAAGLFIQSLAGCEGRKPAYPDAGDPFPLSTLDQAMKLTERNFEPDGKFLLINFWATWCAPCRREMPDLQRLSEALDRKRFDVVGVSVDEDTNLAQEFLLQRKIRFINFQDRDLALASGILGIEVFPTTFIVAPDGRILQRISGEQAWNQDTFDALVEREDRSAVCLPACLAVG